MSVALKNLDELREVFMEEGRIYWKLYAGSSAPTKGTGRKYGQQMEEVSVEESCDLLCSRIERYGSGVFTVMLLANASDGNARGIQQTVKLGNGTANVAGAQSGFTQFAQMMEFYKFMEQQSSASIGGAIEGAIQEVRKDFELERLRNEIRELKQGGPKERIIDGLVKQLPAIADKVLGVSPAVLGTVGIPSSQDTAGNTTDTDDTGEEEEQALFSIDDSVNACMKIQELLPDRNINELLWKLAAFIEKNPEQAKSVLAVL